MSMHYGLYMLNAQPYGFDKDYVYLDYNYCIQTVINTAWLIVNKQGRHNLV